MSDREAVTVVADALRVVIVVLMGLTFACGAPNNPTRTEASGKESSFSVVVRDDLQPIFAKVGVSGTFVLLDVARGQTTIVDRARAERPAVPASTFKIAHSIIALETRVVRDENEVVPYGGRPQPIKAWEKDMSIREAVPASNAAIFQEIARRIGPKRMQEWLNRLGYGNREIGPAIDRFWLDGPLKISPIEQTRFLSSLAQRTLAASVSTQQTVTEILELERTPEYALYGKTGWLFDAEPQLGWWVGWVERGGRSYAFALNIDMASDADADQRVPLGREFLTRLNVLAAVR